MIKRGAAVRNFIVRSSLCPALCFLCLQVATLRASAAVDAFGLTPQEHERKITLLYRLCANRNLSCDYVKSIFEDPRLTIYPSAGPVPEAPSAPDRTGERSPYLTERFSLLTPTSLERCRSFISAHSPAFDAAYKFYGVPREIICGHLRLESNFGIPTPLMPHPLGSAPAVTRLVLLYVRAPRSLQATSSLARRQEFAASQLALLLSAALANGWDLFSIPGSLTGAIGLAQFEPSAFSVAVDGDGDNRIDLFDPEDAVLSVAHYLVTRGWDGNPEHQERAVYAYYGGRYDTDPNKFYMKAVLKYADEVRAYLQDHPIENTLALETDSLATSR